MARRSNEIMASGGRVLLILAAAVAAADGAQKIDAS